MNICNKCKNPRVLLQNFDDDKLISQMWHCEFCRKNELLTVSGESLGVFPR